MSHDRWIWQCDHVIPSSMEAGRGILEELLHELQARHWNRRDLFAVHLAVEESLVNAIRHGNRLDPAKHVSVCCRVSPSRVRIEIADEGPGFDPGAVPDPTDPTRLEVPSGRGLKLIYAYMSRVEYLDCGRRVILERDRSQAA